MGGTAFKGPVLDGFNENEERMVKHYLGGHGIRGPGIGGFTVLASLANALITESF